MEEFLNKKCIILPGLTNFLISHPVIHFFKEKIIEKRSGMKMSAQHLSFIIIDFPANLLLL